MGHVVEVVNLVSLVVSVVRGRGKVFPRKMALFFALAKRQLSMSIESLANSLL